MIKFCAVPEGGFLMGTERESDFEGNEWPQHTVWLDAYSIAETPVTRREWDSFLSSTGYMWAATEEIDRISPTPNHPIIYVSWHDCNEFCAWLGLEMGCRIQLPTEAQWERACRGSHGQLNPYGEELIYAWSPWVTANEDRLRSVGSQLGHRTPVGCLDMWENVREWCFDWYDETAYRAEGPRRNPTGPDRGKYKIYRGGNPLCSGSPSCAYRGWINPATRNKTLGFRVVRCS